MAVLLALLVALAGWALYTESGTRSLLAIARGWLPAGLSVGELRGTVGGTLHVSHFRYRDSAIGMDLSVESAALDVAPLALLARRLHVKRAQIEGVSLQFFPATASAARQPVSKRDPWEAPLAMHFDEVHLVRGELRRPDAAPFILTRAMVAGSWIGTNVEATQLALESPDGTVNLSARIGSRAPRLQQLAANFRWRAGEQQWAESWQPSTRATLEIDRRARTAGQVHVSGMLVPVRACVRPRTRGGHMSRWSASIPVPYSTPRPSTAWRSN